MLECGWWPKEEHGLVWITGNGIFVRSHSSNLSPLLCLPLCLIVSLSTQSTLSLSGCMSSLFVRSFILSTALCLSHLSYPSLSVSHFFSLSLFPTPIYLPLPSLLVLQSPPLLFATHLHRLSSMSLPLIFLTFLFASYLHPIIIPHVHGVIFHTCAHSILSTHTSTQPPFFFTFCINFLLQKHIFYPFCATLNFNILSSYLAQLLTLVYSPIHNINHYYKINLGETLGLYNILII